MFCEGLREDEDVIDVDTHGAVHDEVLENVVHHGLGAHRAIHEAKEHDQELK